MTSVIIASPVGTVVALTLAMQVKHLMADFVLQSDWMARGKGQAEGWLWPLAAHAGVHGLATLGFVLVVEPALWWLGLIDFAVHGAIDRGKTIVGRKQWIAENNTFFWWLFGLDQFLHHVTGIGIIVALVALSQAGNA